MDVKKPLTSYKASGQNLSDIPRAGYEITFRFFFALYERVK
jgi:hypothetical protein